MEGFNAVHVDSGYNSSNYLQRLETYMSDKKQDNGLPEWITTTEAAEIMGIHIESVRRLCRNKTIRCRRFGRTWMVNSEDAENYELNIGGRPYEGNNKNL